MSHKDYKAVIKPFLSEKRYRHSLAVAEEAVHLAKKYGADEEKAYTAGILHDIMKDMPPEEQLKRMTRYDIVLTEVERSGQKLWHAMLGAAYVEQELHIEDQDILNAIRYHTSGRAGMSLLEKVIYMADMCSEERGYPEAEELRKLLKKDLDKALIRALQYSLQWLKEEHKQIDEDSKLALRELERQYYHTQDA